MPGRLANLSSPPPTRPQFADALEKALKDRMRVAHDLDSLDKFKQLFDGLALSKGKNVTMVWRPAGSAGEDSLDVAVTDGPWTPAKGAEPRRIVSSPLCRSLFEAFVGDAAVVPEVRAAAARGLADMVEDDRSEREDKHPAVRNRVDSLG